MRRQVALQTPIITQLIRKNQGFTYLLLSSHWPVVGLNWPVISTSTVWLTPGSSTELRWAPLYVISYTGGVTTLCPALNFFNFCYKQNTMFINHCSAGKAFKMTEWNQWKQALLGHKIARNKMFGIFVFFPSEMTSALKYKLGHEPSFLHSTSLVVTQIWSPLTPDCCIMMASNFLPLPSVYETICSPPVPELIHWLLQTLEPLGRSSSDNTSIGSVRIKCSAQPCGWFREWNSDVYLFLFLVYLFGDSLWSESIILIYQIRRVCKL